MSKANKIRTQMLGGPVKGSSGTSTSGTASSLSFTPFQGKIIFDTSKVH